MLPLLRDNAAWYVCHSPYAQEPIRAMSTPCSVMRAYTGAADAAAPQQRCKPVRLALSRVRIQPHKQPRAVSRVSCVHAQKQLVLLLLSNDVDRYSLSVTIYVPIRAVSRCPCGVMRTCTGAAFAAAPQRRRNPVRLPLGRQVGTHPYTRLCSVSVVSCVLAYTGAACAANPQRRRNS